MTEPQDSASHPYAVWIHTGTFRYLTTYPDEYLAMQAAIKYSSKVIDNPCDW